MIILVPELVLALAALLTAISSLIWAVRRKR